MSPSTTRFTNRSGAIGGAPVSTRSNSVAAGCRKLAHACNPNPRTTTRAKGHAALSCGQMPPRTVLAVNAGSSTVKCAAFALDEPPQLLVRDTIDGGDEASRTARLMQWIEDHMRLGGDAAVAAIGHRFVHGGRSHRHPELLTPALLIELRQLVAFAPNHLPGEIALVERLAAQHPRVAQYACFDTAFHADLPEVARRLPIPDEYDAEGIERYGFHGLSYAYVLREFERLAGTDAASGRLVLAHLGNGSSLAAVHRRRSVDTTMAFTPIGGVVMSTRTGDLDPGVVTYLARSRRMTADEVEDLLSKHSGLQGISGDSGDMRRLLEREAVHPPSRLAVDAYVYSIRKAIGAFAAALGGMDALIFSGGIGEHAGVVRARICDGLAFLGVMLDGTHNAANAAVISSSSARVTVRVIPTDEEIMIARAARSLLLPDSPS